MRQGTHKFEIKLNTTKSTSLDLLLHVVTFDLPACCNDTTAFNKMEQVKVNMYLDLCTTIRLGCYKQISRRPYAAIHEGESF